jgi:hypothetical protein
MNLRVIKKCLKELFSLVPRYNETGCYQKQPVCVLHRFVLHKIV